MNYFSVVNIADTKLLELSYKNIYSFENNSELIIESPPLEKIFPSIADKYNTLILIRHSNKFKQSIQAFNCDIVYGVDIALEKSIKNYEGNIYIGASMVTIYLLLQDNPKYKLHIYLLKIDFDNYSALIKIINLKKFAHLNLI